MKKVALIGILFAFATACGEPDKISKEKEKETPVDIKADCNQVLELGKCGFMVMAGADFANGATISVTVNKIGGGYNQAFVIDRENQPIIPGSNGSYEFLKPRYFPPINPAVSLRSLEQTALPVTISVEAPNRSVATLRFKMLDKDGDGIHDYLDLCDNRTNTCTGNTPASVTTTTTSNDANNDGCDDTLYPNGGCTSPGTVTPPTSPGIPTTSTSSQVREWVRGVRDVVAPIYTDAQGNKWFTTTIDASVNSADDQQLRFTDGPVTIGSSRHIYAQVCAIFPNAIPTGSTANFYVEVLNPNSPWNAVSPWFSHTVTAGTTQICVIVSDDYSPTASLSSKLVQMELGELPVGTIIRARWYNEL